MWRRLNKLWGSFVCEFVWVANEGVCFYNLAFLKFDKGKMGID